MELAVLNICDDVYVFSAKDDTEEHEVRGARFGQLRLVDRAWQQPLAPDAKGEVLAGVAASADAVASVQAGHGVILGGPGP